MVRDTKIAFEQFHLLADIMIRFFRDFSTLPESLARLEMEPEATWATEANRIVDHERYCDLRPQMRVWKEQMAALPPPARGLELCGLYYFWKWGACV